MKYIWGVYQMQIKTHLTLKIDQRLESFLIVLFLFVIFKNTVLLMPDVYYINSANTIFM